MKLWSSNRKPLVSPQLALLSIIGFWVLSTIIISIRASILDFPVQDELISRRAAVTIAGIIFTYLLYLVLRFFDRYSLSVKFIVAAIASFPVAAVISWINFYVFYLYETQPYLDDPTLLNHIKEVRDALGGAPWPEMIDSVIVRYFSILTWAAMYIAICYAREVREAERTASRYAQAAQDAELRSLRYQVNPHFLFNTLNSLSTLVIKGDNAKAEAMIQSLSGFYRTSLSSDPLEDVTLAEEVELQQRYLEIEGVRYPKRLQTVIDIPVDLENTKVPGMILQPLVENAIKYGVSRTNRPVTVTIAARRAGNTTIISVTDDGDMLKSKGKGMAGSGIGLVNVRDRIEARFGERGRLVAEPGSEGGFAATITIADEDFA
jgi:two-component system, LytTR family, sensor kinase